MAQNRKAIKEGKYIGLFLNIETGEYEIWQVYHKQYELWDNGIVNKEEAIEIWRYGEREYPKGL